MKKIVSSIGILGLVCPLVSAQSDVDALRYSFNQSAYTAKSLSIGGAIGALGADIAAVGINPASLAQYKRSEFGITFGLNNISNLALYQEKEKKENLFIATVPSFSLVMTKRNYDKGEAVKKGWVNSNFGFSMGRINQFSRITSFSGKNSQNSMLDYFAELAGGLTKKDIGASDDDFDNGFASLETMVWESYLINYSGDKSFTSSIDQDHRTVDQKNIITSSGATNEFNFSFASNYSNKLYIGGTLKIDRTKYKETNKYSEVTDPDALSIWQNFTLENKLATTGTGVSGNIGMMYLINENFRMGLAYNTPKNYYLDDDYSFNLYTNGDSGVFDYASKKGYYSYSVMTPAKSTLSMAYLFEKKGFISADFETVDYSTMRLRSDDDAFETSNELIQEKYKRVYNIRIGAEVVQDVFRFRAGYNRYDSPLKNSDAALLTQSFSGGIGIKEKSWGMDLGLVHSVRKDNYQPYVLDTGKVPVAENSWQNNQIVLTFTSSF